MNKQKYPHLYDENGQLRPEIAQHIASKIAPLEIRRQKVEQSSLDELETMFESPKKEPRP